MGRLGAKGSFVLRLLLGIFQGPAELRYNMDGGIRNLNGCWWPNGHSCELFFYLSYLCRWLFRLHSEPCPFQPQPPIPFAPQEWASSRPRRPTWQCQWSIIFQMFFNEKYSKWEVSEDVTHCTEHDSPPLNLPLLLCLPREVRAWFSCAFALKR